MRRLRLGALIGFAIVLGGLAKQRVARFEVAEDSMAPALDHGDWILAVPPRAPMRGDVVVYPLAEIDVVKRVVGLPGETVTIESGQVHIDGSVLAEPWAAGPTLPDGEWVLDEAVFCLGDSRSRSSGDSRQIGAVPIDQIRWRVVAAFWPTPRRL